MKKAIRTIELDDGSQAYLWKDTDGGLLSVEIEVPMRDDYTDWRELKKLTRFLDQCAERMKKLGQ